MLFSVKQERDGQGLTRASWRELLSAKLSNGTCDLNGSQEGEEKPRALLPCEGYDGGLSDVIGSEEPILAGVRLKIKACARCG